MSRYPGEYLYEYLARRVRESRTQQDDSCWDWPGFHDNNGYPRIGAKYFGEGLVHRAAYKLLYGSAPPELDHTCNNPNCWNPYHLESVTHEENMRRWSPGPNLNKERCTNGHILKYTGSFIRKDGYLECRECNREKARRHYHKNKEAIAFHRSKLGKSLG
jgi:hypothetical protein